MVHARLTFHLGAHGGKLVRDRLAGMLESMDAQWCTGGSWAIAAPHPVNQVAIDWPQPFASCLQLLLQLPGIVHLYNHTQVLALSKFLGTSTTFLGSTICSIQNDSQMTNFSSLSSFWQERHTVWRNGSIPTASPSCTFSASHSGISGQPGVPERMSVHAGPSCCDACLHRRHLSCLRSKLCRMQFRQRWARQA